MILWNFLHCNHGDGLWFRLMVRLTAVFISRPQSFVEKLMLLAHFKLYRSPILPFGAIHISPCRWIHDSVREKAEKRWEEEKFHFHTFPTQFSPFFLSLQWCLKAWLIFRRNSPRVIQYFNKLNEMMHGCHERERRRKREWMWKIWISHPFLFFHPSPLSSSSPKRRYEWLNLCRI